MKTPTWKDIVAAVMEEKSGPVTLDELYEAVEGHKRTQSNKNWKEKIRQTLQIYKEFERLECGIWRLTPQIYTGNIQRQAS